VGIGYDSHRFVKGKPLFLGGIEIPFEFGLESHTDGDILIHALIDALLGAIAYKDIGRIFKDTDEKYKGVRSTELLKSVSDILKEKNAKIVNIDATLILEKPKISPHVEKIKETLSNLLGIEKERISIKGKTNEGMGFIGRSEGASSIVVVLVQML